jgi:hypothetical protein
MREAISSYETSVNIYQTTWCYIPEDSHLHYGLMTGSLPHYKQLQVKLVVLGIEKFLELHYVIKFTGIIRYISNITEH